jgi:outer membrane protein assembly factor BamB
VLEPGETCDGKLLGGESCESATGKPATGSLACTTGCQFDLSGCHYCGNGVREGLETCDQADLGAFDCSVVAPGATGTIVCSPHCQLDTSGCTPSVAYGDRSGLAADAPWPMMGGGPQHPFRTTVVGPQKLTLAWAKPTTGVLWNGPVIGAGAAGEGDVIYVGGDDGGLYAFRSDGSVKWKFQAGTEIEGSPAIAHDGSIHVATLAGVLYAVTPAGTKQWSATLDGPSGSSPLILPSGVTVVATTTGSLVGYDAVGALSFKTKLGPGDQYSSSFGPALHPSGVVLSPLLGPKAQTTKLFAVDPVDGSTAWTANVTSGINASSPVVTGAGVVYIPAFASSLYAILPGGALAWTSTIAGPKSAVALGADGTVYGGGGATDQLRAFSPVDGSVVWTSPHIPPQVDGMSPPLVGGDGLVYGGGWNDGAVYILSPGGDLLDSYELPMVKGQHDRVFGSPAIGTDGTLYVAGLLGTVYAFSK